MKYYRWIAAVVVAALFAVSTGCSKPDTPQEVTTEFWQAVVKNNAKDAVALSTLTDTSVFGRFGRDGLNTLPDFGRVVIDANQASIVTYLPAGVQVEKAAPGERREITTYLVQINDRWLVDFQRTYEAVVRPEPFSGLRHDINKLREQFDGIVGRSSEQISEQMDQLARDFENYSDETGKKAEEVLENFGRSLEDLRKRIEKSLEEAEKRRQESTKPETDSLEQAAI